MKLCLFKGKVHGSPACMCKGGLFSKNQPCGLLHTESSERKAVGRQFNLTMHACMRAFRAASDGVLPVALTLFLDAVEGTSRSFIVNQITKLLTCSASDPLYFPTLLLHATRVSRNGNMPLSQRLACYIHSLQTDLYLPICVTRQSALPSLPERRPGPATRRRVPG